MKIKLGFAFRPTRALRDKDVGDGKVEVVKQRAPAKERRVDEQERWSRYCNKP